MAEPFIRVVVLHHQGLELTARCLAHLAAVDWPADRLDVVVVDNGSGHDLSDVVRTVPTGRLVRSAVNLGYAGGCNLGIGDLDGVDHVALVNNDAYVEPGWLRALVGELESDPTLGGVTPRVLFDDRYASITFASEASARTWVDRRPVGATLHGLRAAGVDVWDRCRRAAGFWGPEPGPDGWVERTMGEARLLVPGGPDGLVRDVEVCVSGPPGRRLAVAGPADASATVELGPVPRWHRLPGAAAVVDVINNVGTVVLPDLHGADRGMHEPADSRYLVDEEVDAWSGTAPLLSATHLRAVGCFDERLFAYYEDLDLALRARRAGWHHRYVAGAGVRHTHAATSGLRSQQFTFLNERNRLLVLAWHRGRSAAWRAAGRHLLATGGYARRDVVAPLVERRRPWLGQVKPRLRAVGAFARASLARSADSGAPKPPR